MATASAPRTVVIASGARYRRPDIPTSPASKARACPIGRRRSKRALRRRGDRAGRRWQFRRPGGGLPGAEGQARAPLVRGRPRSDDVALSDRPHRRRCPMSSSTPAPRSSAWKATNGGLCRRTFRGRDLRKPASCPLRHLFLFIGADPNGGWLAKRWRWTTRVSSSPAASCADRPADRPLAAAA